jgi:hypothetical protein
MKPSIEPKVPSIATVKYAIYCIALIAAQLPSLAGAAMDNSCDRQCLKGISARYFDALALRDPSRLPVARSVTFVENGRTLKLGEGHWKAGAKESFRLELFDPKQGGIGIEAVVPSVAGPAVMALRLKVENRLITEIEAVLAPAVSEKSFSRPQNLANTKPSRFWTRTIRPTERNSRYEIIAAVEGYWRAFETTGTPEYVRAPLLPDTVRIENGIQTTLVDVTGPQGDVKASTAAEQFDIGVFKGAKITDRRYLVIDEEVGALMCMVHFGEGAQAMPVGEFFAVTQGKIMEIQAVFDFVAPAPPAAAMAPAR